MSAAASLMSETAPADPRFASVGCVFFVIGAQKAGTTWLSHYCLKHPNIAVPYWKEHDYWNMVEGRPEPSRMLRAQIERREREQPLRKLASTLWFTKHAKRQRAITLALRATASPHAPHSAYADVLLENVEPTTGATGELCPEYAVLSAETFGEMAALAPNVRFVFLMRDPVSRCISAVRHTLSRQPGKPAITHETLSAAVRVSAAQDLCRHQRLSRYDLTIDALERAVPADKIAYVFFEKMFDQVEVERICDFLGVPFVPGKIDKRSLASPARNVAVSDTDRALIAKALAPTYRFAEKRFGSALPAKWRANAALCMQGHLPMQGAV